MTREELELKIRSNPALAKLNQDAFKRPLKPLTPIKVPIVHQDLSKPILDAKKPKINVDHKDPRTLAKLESNPSHASLGETKLQGASETAIVRIESVRKNLLDTDNIVAKYLVDLLRYANILYDDNPEQTSIQTTQRKCRPQEEEHTQVTIEIYA